MSKSATLAKFFQIPNFRSPTWLILIGLMAPTVTTGMNHHMFSVAIPFIRNDFGIATDAAAWVVLAYTLPFMALMPLFGTLSDQLGKRLLLTIGMTTSILGTLIVLFSPSLRWLIIGRVVQGIGAAGLNPVCIAIISHLFPPRERGKMMGTWNSAMPIMGLIGPLIGGTLIDLAGWRAIYPLILLSGFGGFYLIQRNLPELPGAGGVGSLRKFDWTGVALLIVASISLVFFTASRPITGVAALQDLRLLGVTSAAFTALILWERRHVNPFLKLHFFAHLDFTIPSVIAGLRMFLMSSANFVGPLFLADVYGLSAKTTGLIIAMQAGALFLMSRTGGQLADRWGGRRPIMISMIGQVIFSVAMALLPAGTTIWVPAWLIALHGLTIGVSLAPLHRAAMSNVPSAELGAVAGLYSMVRFAGIVLGAALAGTILQFGLDANAGVDAAYRNVYWIYAAAAAVAAVLSFWIREPGTESSEQ